MKRCTWASLNSSIFWHIITVFQIGQKKRNIPVELPLASTAFNPGTNPEIGSYPRWKGAVVHLQLLDISKLMQRNSQKLNF